MSVIICPRDIRKLIYNAVSNRIRNIMTVSFRNEVWILQRYPFHHRSSMRWRKPGLRYRHIDPGSIYSRRQRTSGFCKHEDRGVSSQGTVLFVSYWQEEFQADKSQDTRAWFRGWRIKTLRVQCDRTKVWHPVASDVLDYFCSQRTWVFINCNWVEEQTKLEWMFSTWCVRILAQELVVL